MSKDSRHEIWGVLDALQMDHRALGAKIVEVRAMVAAMNLPAGGKTPRAGSPRELHPDACPECEIVAGHTTDCPQAPRRLRAAQ